MSLLQEMEKHGLADCEFNRQLLKGGIMKQYEIIIPKRVAFTENEVYIVEAENETEAFAKVNDGFYEPEYEDAGDYETINTYETEIREIENA